MKVNSHKDQKLFRYTSCSPDSGVGVGFALEGPAFSTEMFCVLRNPLVLDKPEWLVTLEGVAVE